MGTIKYGTYITIKSLNLFDAPCMEANHFGVIPGGVRVVVIKWHLDEFNTIWACIGGYPEQWARVTYNQEKNVNYIGGDE